MEVVVLVNGFFHVPNAIHASWEGHKVTCLDLLKARSSSARQQATNSDNYSSHTSFVHISNGSDCLLYTTHQGDSKKAKPSLGYCQVAE